MRWKNTNLNNSIINLIWKKFQLFTVLFINISSYCNMSLSHLLKADGSPYPPPSICAFVSVLSAFAHTHSHTSTEWRDSYSCPTGLWQVMRSPTEQDVIILLSMSLKKKGNKPRDPMLILYFASTHKNTHRQRWTTLQQTKVVFDTIDITTVCRLPVTEHCENKNVKTKTPSTLLGFEALCSATNYAAKYKSPWAICMPTTASNCLY